MEHPRSRSKSRTNLEEFKNSCAALREYSLQKRQPCGSISTDKMTENDFARLHGTINAINANTRSTTVDEDTLRAQQSLLRTDSAVSRNTSLCDPYTALLEGNALRILAAACCEPYVSRENEHKHTSEDMDLEITPATVDESNGTPQVIDIPSHTADISSTSGTEFEDTDGFVEEPINNYCVQVDATANERVKRFMLERFREFQEKHNQDVITTLLPVLSQIHVRHWSEDPTESREISTLERVIKETFITERCIAQLKRLLEQENQYRTELIVRFGI